MELHDIIKIGVIQVKYDARYKRLATMQFFEGMMVTSFPVLLPFLIVSESIEPVDLLKEFQAALRTSL